MLSLVPCIFTALLIPQLVVGAPAASSHIPPSSSFSPADGEASSTSASEPSQTVAFASNNPNTMAWSLDGDEPLDSLQPIRGNVGATILGQTNAALVLENPDLLAPPSTDVGTVQNAKWPFSLSHTQLQSGGWSRQQNTNEMPIAKSMAGVNMRLAAGAIRELHWHSSAEWAYVLKGSTQVTVVNQNGENYISTVNAGDLWYFPPGIPHSLQATDDDPEGSEFLLVFDNGEFNDDSTFQLTDWMSQVPKEVLASNFQVEQSAFSSIPGHGLYIFPSNPPPDNQVDPVSPQGTSAMPYSFALSQVNATQLSGGTVKIVDSTTFKVATAIAAAEVTVEVGGIRELHWHPTQDEWTYYLQGQARVTLFASGQNSRTFDYQAGDIGYVPAPFGHYVQNVGNSTLKYLEIFNTDRFEDVSLSQWLALVPPSLVEAHLQVSADTISHFNKSKAVVVGPTDITSQT